MYRVKYIQAIAKLDANGLNEDLNAWRWLNFNQSQISKISTAFENATGRNSLYDTLIKVVNRTLLAIVIYNGVIIAHSIYIADK